MAVAFRILKPDTNTWRLAWQALIEKYGDAACYDEFSGQAWQYMSTTWVGSEAHHEFRHRCLPTTGKREDFVATTQLHSADYVGWVER